MKRGLFPLLLALALISCSQKQSGWRVRFPNPNPNLKITFKLKNRDALLLSSGRRINAGVGEELTTFEGAVLRRGEKIGFEIEGEPPFTIEFYCFLPEGQLCLSSEAHRKCFKPYPGVRLLRADLKGNRGEFELVGGKFAALSYPFVVKRLPEDYIFLIVADTLRRDRVGVYGASQLTPNLDRLAADGVVFERAYTTSPWTLPAIVSLFSGLYSTNHGANYRKPFSSSLKLMAQYFSSKFKTIAFTGDFMLANFFGFSRGFDLYHEWTDDPFVSFAARRLFNRAIEALREEKFGRLFFFLHSYQIHNLYAPEKELVEKKLGWKLPSYTFNPVSFIEEGRALCRKADPEQEAFIKRIYNAGVYTFDYHLGRFLDYLRKRGIYRKATIILLADHGEELADHGCWEHGHSLYEEIIRVPLIIKFPSNRFAGRRVEEPVSIVDILPTLLALYRIEGPLKLDGINLAKALESEFPERPLFSYLAPYSLRKHLPGKVCVVKGDFKLIKNMPFLPSDRAYFTFPPEISSEFELYNLKEDRGETRNLYPHHPAAQALKKLLPELKISFKRGGLPERLKKKLKSLGYL